MERIELQAASRTIHGKQVKQLRADGWIPAVVFGPDRPSETIKIEQRALFKCLQQAGSTALIYLFVDNGPQPILALARDIQRDVLSGDLLHVDFYEVRLTEKVKTMPRIEIVGESPLAHSGAAVMVQAMNEVEVECLPTDLIHSIHVDVSGMDSLDKNILIRDLPVSVGVTILADPDDVVVSLVPVRMEKEEEAAAEEEGVMAFGAEPEPEEEE
jgi:large subunit ribosomal protein L25